MKQNQTTAYLSNTNRLNILSVMKPENIQQLCERSVTCRVCRKPLHPAGSLPPLPWVSYLSIRAVVKVRKVLRRIQIGRREQSLGRGGEGDGEIERR